MNPLRRAMYCVWSSKEPMNSDSGFKNNECQS